MSLTLQAWPRFGCKTGYENNHCFLRVEIIFPSDEFQLTPAKFFSSFASVFAYRKRYNKAHTVNIERQMFSYIIVYTAVHLLETPFSLMSVETIHGVE